MGISTAPDIFQNKMSDLMRELEFVRVYLDDLLIITNGSFEDHLAKLNQALHLLQKAGLKCNVNKSFFCQQLMSNKKTRVFMPSARKTNKNIRQKSDKMSSSSPTRGEYTSHLV